MGDNRVWVSAVASGDGADPGGQSIEAERQLGEPTPFACPDCNGNLWQIDDSIRRFRCHVGHAFTADALAEVQAEKLDVALWSSLRSLRERAELLRRLVDDALKAARISAAGFGRSAAESEEQADTLTEFIMTRHGRTKKDHPDAAHSDP